MAEAFLASGPPPAEPPRERDGHGTARPARAGGDPRRAVGKPKRLPLECFYDDLGSALFEAITLLPEYGLTRAGRRLLERHAPEVAARCRRPWTWSSWAAAAGGPRASCWSASAPRAGALRAGGHLRRGAAGDASASRGACPGSPVAPQRADHFHGPGRRRPRRAAARTCWSCSWAATSATSTGPRPPASWPASASRCGPGDALLLAADLEKAEDPAAGRLRRLPRPDRRLRPQRAGPAEPRAGRRLRPAGLPPPRVLRPRERRIEMHLCPRPRRRCTCRPWTSR